MPADLNKQICFTLYTTSMAINRTYKPMLDGMGITYPQYLILCVLSEAGEIAVDAIAERLSMETNTVTTPVKRLEMAGLVARQRGARDARHVKIKLTDAGRALLVESNCLGETLIERSGMAREEVESLNKQIQVLRDALGRKRAVLDAIPAAVGIVDAGLKIRFINSNARRYLAAPDAALHSMRSGPFASGDSYLSAASGEEAATLRALVASATHGGLGGSMMATSRGGTSIAVLVSPTPRHLADNVADDGAGALEALALVVLRPLDRMVVPTADILSGVFGFSRAEAEVATALSGGASAEEVARRRGVSLMTVRSQIRTILAKSESENLRAFERSMGTLAALAPPANQAP